MFKLNTIFIYPLICIAFACTPAISQAQSLKTTPPVLMNCPEGSYQLGSMKLCLANNLDSTAVDTSSSQYCLSNYERPLGGRVCLAEALALDIVNEYYIVSGPYKEQCPSRFKRSKQSSLCIAEHLSLDLVNGKLTLLAPTLECSRGYEQLPQARTCTAIADRTNTKMSAAVDPVNCAPGYIKPPGVDDCLSFPLAMRTDATIQFGIKPPPGECPQDWYRIKTGGFCFPRHSAIACDPSDSSCAQNSSNQFKVVSIDDGDCCPKDESSSIHYISLFNSDTASFTSIPVVMCGPPAGTVHVMCQSLDVLMPNGN